MDDKGHKHSVHFTSKSQLWNTPKDFFADINAEWKFTLDAACVKSSALLPKYFTPEDDSLVQDWSNDIVWLNPPYDDLKTWMNKCEQEYTKGATIVTLIPSRTDTKAFQDFIAKSATCICFIRGRLKFANPELESQGLKPTVAPFPSCIAVFDDNLTKEKIECLQRFGTIVKILR